MLHHRALESGNSNSAQYCNIQSSVGRKGINIEVDQQSRLQGRDTYYIVHTKQIFFCASVFRPAALKKKSEI